MTCGVLKDEDKHFPEKLFAPFFCSPGDVWWAASDLGWIVGHEYICYSPLLGGNTSVVYEGKPVGTPDAAQFFRRVHFPKKQRRSN